MSALNVVVWGLGQHAVKRILPAVTATEGARLHGVVSRRESAVAACRSAYGCQGWTDESAMLQDPGVDAVYVATPSGLHPAHAERVLGAGKHAWVEKPVALTAADARALADRSRAAGLGLCEGFMYLFHPHFRDLSQGVAQGRIGRPLSVTCRFGIPELTDPGFRTSRVLGGGALHDVGSYGVSAVLGLFPDAVVSVQSAALQRRSGSEVDTSGHAIMLADEVEAHLEWRTGSAYRNELFVWGDAGSVSTDLIFSKPADHAPVLQWRDVHGRTTDAVCAPANHFVEMLRAFTRWTTAPGAAELERRTIVRRAEVMDAIEARSN